MSTFVNLLEVIYPVGSIYQSMNSTSPATLFGGTWSAIKSRFLYANESNEIGGSSKHSHYYGIAQWGYYGAGADNSIWLRHFTSTDTSGDWQSARWDADIMSADDFHHKGNATLSVNNNVTNSTTKREAGWGGTITSTSQSDYLPPYQSCYTWRRTA